MVVELLSKNYTETRHTPVSAVPAGTMTLLNDTYGFPLADVAAGEEGAFIIKAEKVRCPKEAPQVQAEGESAYWDDVTNDNVTNVVGSNKLIGSIQKPAASADTTTIIQFDGREAFLKA